MKRPINLKANIFFPRVTCVFSVHSKDKWQVGYSMRPRDTTRERSITILYHAIGKYSDQYSECDIRAAHDGKVGCNTETVDSVEGTL